MKTTSCIIWSVIILVVIVAYFAIKSNKERTLIEVPNTISVSEPVPFYPNNSGKE